MLVCVWINTRYVSLQHALSNIPLKDLEFKWIEAKKKKD